MHGALVRHGATHLIGLPDNTSGPLFTLAERSGQVRVVTVTREGEAFAIACGVWIGGGRPVILIQNTGLLESGDALRGTALRIGAPLLCLITYRGHASLRNADAGSDNDAVLTRADLDSAALLLEPTLDAWRVPYTVFDRDADTANVVAMWEAAVRRRRLHAVLITQPLRDAASGGEAVR